MKKHIPVSIHTYLKALSALLFFIVTTVKTEAQTKVVVTEINYSCDSTRESGDWIEIFNPDAVNPVDLSNWRLYIHVNTQLYLIPPGTILGPNNYLVLVQDTTFFHHEYPNVHNVLGPFKFAMSGKGDNFTLSDNTNQAIISIAYSDSLPWPKGADGNARTLEIKNIFGNPNDGTNWFDGCMGGSPGGAYFPCNEKIIISEVNYNSIPRLYAGDWFEIRNIGNSPVDLSGWTLTDKDNFNFYKFPSTPSLQPHQNLVVAQDMVAFKNIFPNVNNVIGPFNFPLINKGDRIKLYDASGKLNFSLAYDDKAPWPTEANGAGFTCELSDSSGKMDEGANWFKGCFGGSPGTYYTSQCSTIGIAGINKDEVKLYPNPAGNFINIDLPQGEIPVKFEMFNMLGLKVLSEKLNQSSVLNINVSALENGVFLYSFQSKASVLTGKIIIRR